MARRQALHGDGAAIGETLLADDGRRVFLKSAPAAQIDDLACEHDGLEALARPAALRVPAVLGFGEAGGRAFLLLEHLDIRPLDEAGGARMGEALARLHADTAARHGWHRDNLIGRGTQPNRETTDWCLFWREQRLGHQLAALRERGGDGRVLDMGEALMARLEERLAGHRPAPSLLHGDLWTGNLGQDEAGRPLVFDPAVYRGDRETDLAMTRLFGGVPGSLARVYEAAWPLPSGHEWRRELYNLYHLLNHAVLFGGGYQQMAARSLRWLLDA